MVSEYGVAITLGEWQTAAVVELPFLLSRNPLVLVADRRL